MSVAFDVEKIRFAQRQRLTYIESVAYWEGRVDRPRVCSAFNISENHVTKDFRLYKDAFPGNIRYDETQRAYLATPKFKPRIGKGSAEEYLSLLRSHAELGDGGLLAEAGSVVVGAVPTVRSRLPPTTLNAVTRAISAKTGLAITYQSRNLETSAERRVWPHALVFSATRWHTRAWDESRSAYIDLVLQRIQSASPIKKLLPSSASARDIEWETFVEIEVIPSRHLSPGQAAVIAQEFGMAPAGKGWIWKARMRECLAGYFIYLHRLELAADPHRLIELKDASIAARYLTSRREDVKR